MAPCDLCDCGKDIISIVTTDNGEYCDACFNRKYGAKYRNEAKKKYKE